MTKNLSRVEYDIRSNYHIPNCSDIMERMVDAIFLSRQNTEEHEMMKCKIAFEIMKNGHHVIVEAARNPKRRSEHIVDVVDLTTGDEYEIETTMQRALRHVMEDGIIIIPVGWNKEDPKWKQLRTEYIKKKKEDEINGASDD